MEFRRYLSPAVIGLFLFCAISGRGDTGTVNWIQISSVNSPSNCHHNAAYDIANQRLVVCARSFSDYQVRTWFLTVDGTWTNGPSGPTPINPGIGDCEVAYDADRQVIVMYTVSNSVAQVWELSGNTWSQRTFATPPLACDDGASLQYDPIRRKTVLVGGTAGGASQTWLWDGTNWARTAESSTPNNATIGGMAFDEARGEMVLLPAGASATNGCTNTYTFIGTNWVAKNTAHFPTNGTTYFTLAYDRANQWVIKYGGEQGGYATNTWAWNGSDWSLVDVQSNPGPLIDMAMTWFPPWGTIVMQGGWWAPFGVTWDPRTNVWLYASSPVITNQPVSQAVTSGCSVVFSVGAIGALPFTYQWQKDGSAISGASSGSYSIASASSSDTGSYHCVISNIVGIATSSVASLTLTNTAVISVVPVYRLYSYGAPESTFEHLFTINEDEKDVLSTWPSWQYEGVAWYAMTNAAASGIVPLYRLYAPGVKQHHYTIDETEYAINADNGTWNGEGIQYYVYSSQATGTLPVYRFYHTGMYLHHFTISEDERANIDAHPEWGYTYELIAYYVYESAP